MTNDENVHAGHRARMLEKLNTSSNSLEDYELLEILLYNFLPRINTNPIAHKLLRTFGSLQKVFSASTEQLKTVEGIGKKTAEKIKDIGEIFCRIKEENLSKIFGDVGYSYFKSKDAIIELFDKNLTEKFILLFLDKDKKFITKLTYDGGGAYAVQGNMNEIANAFAINKPSFVVVCHNHTSGSVEPSGDDDITTIKISLLCQMHSATLLDHVIVSGKKSFSYFTEHRIEEVNKFTLNNLIINTKS